MPFFVLITVFIMRMASFWTIFVPVAIFSIREEIPQWERKDTTSDARLQTASPHEPLNRQGRQGAPAFLWGVSCCDFFLTLMWLREREEKQNPIFSFCCLHYVLLWAENVLDWPQRISRRERTGRWPRRESLKQKAGPLDRGVGGSAAGASTGLRLLKQ